MSNRYSLTNSIGSLTKWTGKTSFALIMLTVIFASITTNTANPNFNYYDLSSGSNTVLQTVNLQSGNLQFGLATEYGDAVEFTLYKVTYIHLSSDNSSETLSSAVSPDDAEVLVAILTITATEFFRDLTLDAGEYRFTVYSPDNAGIYFGFGSFNYGLVTLTLSLSLIFLIVFTLFNIVWPIALALIIINTIIGEDKSSPPPSKKTSIRPEKTNISDNWYDQLTRNDWIGISFVFLFLFIAIGEPDSPFFVFAVILAIILGININERLQTKNRILNLLKLYHSVDIEYINNTLFMNKNKRKHIRNVLQYMILDLGLPIEYDLPSGRVTYIGPNVGATSSQSLKMHNGMIIDNAPKNIKLNENISNTSEHDGADTLNIEEHKPNSYYCTGCGELLIKKTKYCYNCGQKTKFE